MCLFTGKKGVERTSPQFTFIPLFSSSHVRDITIFRLTRAGSGAYTVLTMWGLIRCDVILLKTSQCRVWAALEKLDLSGGEAGG